VVAALQAGGQAMLDGVWGSSCALAAAGVANSVPGTLLVVCSREAQLDGLLDDLAIFSPLTCHSVPAWEATPGEQIIHDEIFGERLRTLKAMVSPDPPRIVVASIESLLQSAPRPEDLQRDTRTFAVGDTIDLDGILRWLAEHGFHSTGGVDLPGEFSSRGGILDVFAADWDKPVRLEFFGDELESMRHFDVATQRSLESLDTIDITVLRPATDAAPTAHLTDFLPAGSWCLLVEPEKIIQDGEHYLTRVEQIERYHGVHATLARLAKFPTLSVASLSAGSEASTAHLAISSVERFSGDFARVAEELSGAAGADDVYIVCPTDAENQRLAEILSETPLVTENRLHLVEGRLTEGFRLLDRATLVLSASDLFHRHEPRRTARRHTSKPIDNFLQLSNGDLVIHLAHGIGRYRGLKLLDKKDHTEEHLEIEFHGGSRIYVPSSKIELIQKYVGGRKGTPTLAKIGGATWLRQKQSAEDAVSDLAVEMLEVQAARDARPGIAFGADSDWQREFDAAFPYTETPDQLLAIEAIKNDMHRSRPMDRLLCGDVGFGKTEMAIRAVFKAIDNGYQVAVLAPTTILVEQHFRTFCERMAEFPFVIAKLSRFCTAKEQRETVKRLESGAVDVVIGTHRLASKDVHFNNLGLLIIDEEQRFGVEVKERLKSLRSTVDVLTMTATPIPRTLHMSLVGARDISNLLTPPKDRIAIETKVTRFKDEVIRHAVLRELNRGGQIYFVHNRVHDIEKLADRLRYIVPEASLRIGHGQMHEGELETVMIDFVAGKFDLLLATTIVESGLDIPNANTIFIDEANRYGLSELHQLRGRVGRYKHHAHCYLLLDPRKHITPDAARRLRAIEEFSEMGAGFAISMRDLEIRGAGNLLGTQQSGHIAHVGYELYCQLLETAVRKLKRLPPKLSVDVTVELPGEAFLPREYVPRMRDKIDLYRRLSRITTDHELVDLRDEMHDRFGTTPKSVQRMLALAELKIDAAIWQIDEIRMEDGAVVLGYTNRARIEQLAEKCGRKLRIVDGRNVYLVFKNRAADPDRILAAVKSVLH